MITADEARALVEASEANIQRRLEQISILVTSCAGRGERKANLDRINDTFFDVKKTMYSSASASLSPAMLRIRDTLMKHPLNFGFSVVEYKSDRRNILGNMDDDDEPIQTNYNIELRW